MVDNRSVSKQPIAKPRIPVNLIAGPLGVGKTTAINHLLACRPPQEKWAVLINEYGLVGLDAALLSDATSANEVQVREVAGGCICCSASFMFDVSLVLLLQRRPDRLLIEPTGLAELSGILDTLGRPGIQDAVDVRSVISLLDPARLNKDLQRDEVKDQIDAADVLLANRSDLAGIDNLETFERWSNDLFPPKRYVGRIERGRIPLEFLDLVAERSASQARGAPVDGHHHLHAHASTPSEEATDGASSEAVSCDASRPIVRRDHRSAVGSTVGWVCWAGLTFDSVRIAAWLKEVSAMPGVRRVKAVLHTDKEWRSFNLADGAEETRPTGYRRDSRLELVIEGTEHPDPAALEQALRDCLVTEAPGVSANPCPT